jgi:hypothetical protein
MSPWTFGVKFPYGTQITSGSLKFAAGEDENLKMLPPGPTPERLASVYGQAPCFSAISLTTGGACLGLDPYVGLHIRAIQLVRGIPIMTSILRPSAGASRSSSSTMSDEQDSTDDYPEIRGSTCGDSIEEGCLIVMVAPAGGPSQNNSSRYPTIGRSEASGARTPNDGMIQNVNPDFNAIRLQTIIESIQWMTPEGSSLVALAQQGVEAANFVIAQRSADNLGGEPFVDNRSNDRAKRAQSETASSASGNRRLANNDVCRWITWNRHLR